MNDDFNLLLFLFILLVRPGQNTLRRRSVESTVTIPYERTFRNLDTRPAGKYLSFDISKKKLKYFYIFKADKASNSSTSAAVDGHTTC